LRRELPHLLQHQALRGRVRGAIRRDAAGDGAAAPAAPEEADLPHSRNDWRAKKGLRPIRQGCGQSTTRPPGLPPTPVRRTWDRHQCWTNAHGGDRAVEMQVASRPNEVLKSSGAEVTMEPFGFVARIRICRRQPAEHPSGDRGRCVHLGASWSRDCS
jgi:hypothetical protein